MQFTVTIEDERRLAGLAAARAAYNATLPETTTMEVEVDGAKESVEIPNPERCETDEQYIQFVMDRATLSYASQYGIE